MGGFESPLKLLSSGVCGIKQLQALLRLARDHLEHRLLLFQGSVGNLQISHELLSSGVCRSQQCQAPLRLERERADRCIPIGKCLPQLPD